jgi:hypothetical protein
MVYDFRDDVLQLIREAEATYGSDPIARSGLCVARSYAVLGRPLHALRRLDAVLRLPGSSNGSHFRKRAFDSLAR